MSYAGDTMTSCRYVLNRYLDKHPSVKRTVNALLANLKLEPCAKENKTPLPLRHSQETRNAIIAALRKGVPNCQIASAYNVSRTYVTNMRVKAGIEPKVRWGEGMDLDEKRAKQRAAYQLKKQNQIT